MHPLVREVQKAQTKPVPEVKPGYTIRVSQKIKEGSKERVQAFEGLVIKVNHGEGTEKSVTVRKIVEGIGVEKVFPLQSPQITKIEVKKKAKVRRAKLYYMRQRSGKSARLQERHVSDEERRLEQEKMDAMVAEAVAADEKRKAEEAAAEGGDDQAPDQAPKVAPETQAPEAAPEKESAPEVPAEAPTEAPAEKEADTPAESDAPADKPAEPAEAKSEGETEAEKADEPAADEAPEATPGAEAPAEEEEKKKD